METLKNNNIRLRKGWQIIDDKTFLLNFFRDGEILERLFYNRTSDVEKKILENRVRMGCYSGKYERKYNIADYVTIEVIDQEDHYEIKMFNYSNFCGFGTKSIKTIDK